MVVLDTTNSILLRKSKTLEEHTAEEALGTKINREETRRTHLEQRQETSQT